MSRLVFKDGRSMPLTKEQGHEVWAILQGEQEPNEEQEKFMGNIQKIFLNFGNAPDSYLKENLTLFIAWCKRDWLVDYSGNTTRPQTAEQWSVARKWGFAPKST